MPTVGVFAAIFEERGRILCVKRDYGDRCWTLPGGSVEAGESPLAALAREVREETGYVVRTGALIGVYATPWKDDVALCFTATILDRVPWAPNAEIAAVGFFARDALPEPFSPRARSRIEDAFEGRTGVVHVFEEADSSMLARERVYFPSTRSNHKPAVSPADQQIIRQTFGFLRGIVANPELAKDIPEGANVVLIPRDDPELAAIEIKAGMLALSRGMDVYFRHIRPGDIVPAPEPSDRQSSKLALPEPE